MQPTTAMTGEQIHSSTYEICKQTILYEVYYITQKCTAVDLIIYLNLISTLIYLQLQNYTEYISKISNNERRCLFKHVKICSTRVCANKPDMNVSILSYMQ